MKDDVDEVRSELQRSALDAYRDDYHETLERWRNMDKKAQDTASLGGIFIAGAFAFISQADLKIGSFAIWLLGTALLLLSLSFFLCLLVMRIRRIPAPPLGDEMWKLVSDLLALRDPGELVTRLPRFVNDQIKRWEQTTTSMQQSLGRKIKWVWWAQVTLAVSIAVVAFAALVVLYLRRDSIWQV